MIGLLLFVLTILVSPFRSKSRLEAENAVLRHQLIVLRRKMQGRVRLTNNDSWFFIQLYRWLPSIFQVLTALRTVKQRLHQATFREAVITAYNGRCALSGLPEPLLLDAAHIIADKDERLGQPVVSNGIPLSKIHHAAFDAHLIGIDPDFCMHVSDRLLCGRELSDCASISSGEAKL